jgi:hypothetical protein
MLIIEIVRPFVVFAEGQFALGTFAAFAELVLAAGQLIDDPQTEIEIIVLTAWRTGPLAAFILMSSNSVSILT